MPETVSKRPFQWRALLFLLFPLWSLISGFIPGFQNSEYLVVALEQNQPVLAGQAGLFRAYLYSSDFVKIFFFLGLISAILIGIYGVLAAFFPRLRGFKPMAFTIGTLLVLQGVGYMAGGFLLANYIERFSIDYLASQGRLFDQFSALAFLNVNLLFSMGIPAVALIWWIWICLATRFRKTS